MMIRLEVPEGPEQTLTPHTYHQERVRIGSAETNDITLSAEGVTKFHAVVDVEDQQGALVPGVDGGALQVNNTPVEGKTLLQPGDRLRIGSVEILYKLVPFPKPEHHRRTSWLEWATVALLIGGVLGQVLFLLLPSRSLRQEIQPERLIPTPTPEAVPTPTPLPQPLIEPTPIPLVVAPTVDAEPTAIPEAPQGDPEPLFRQGEAFLAEDRLLDAERSYRESLRMEPSYLPAKIALARLLDRQSNYEDSLRFWEQVRREAPAGSLEAMDARLEISSVKRKLERLERETSVPELRDPESIPVPTAEPLRPAFPAPQNVPVVEQAAPVRVENIRMERYAESARYDDFRILSFHLAHQAGTPSVPPGSLKVRVSFFEQAGPRVRQADIPEPRIVLNPEQGLARNQVLEDLSAAYEVPPGKGADGRVYYGAIIEVFVDGQEVTRAADPAFLLDYIR